ncbi:MAG: hypothetical protein ACI9G1_002026, partial [Pirellulaceae bacterium]
CSATLHLPHYKLSSSAKTAFTKRRNSRAQ